MSFCSCGDDLAAYSRTTTQLGLFSSQQVYGESPEEFYMRRSMLMAMLTAMVLTAFSTSLLGQQTGSVVGTVADKTGAVIPGANVTLTNTASKDVRRTTTNAEGFFAF